MPEQTAPFRSTWHSREASLLPPRLWPSSRPRVRRRSGASPRRSAGPSPLPRAASSPTSSGCLRTRRARTPSSSTVGPSTCSSWRCVPCASPESSSRPGAPAPRSPGPPPSSWVWPASRGRWATSSPPSSRSAAPHPRSRRPPTCSISRSIRWPSCASPCSCGAATMASSWPPPWTA